MLTLLVVDDEKVCRDGIRFLVKRFQYDLNVLEAENGVEALKCLAQESVDILITDIRMPFMDGLELIENAVKKYPDLQIAVFSAYGEFEYAKKAMEYRVSRYILKPVNVDEVRQTLDALIESCAPAVNRGIQDAITGVLEGNEAPDETAARLIINNGIIAVSLKDLRSYTPDGFADEMRKLLPDTAHVIMLDDRALIFVPATLLEMASLSENVHKTLMLHGHPCTVLFSRPMPDISTAVTVYQIISDTLNDLEFKNTLETMYIEETRDASNEDFTELVALACETGVKIRTDELNARDGLNDLFERMSKARISSSLCQYITCELVKELFPSLKLTSRGMANALTRIYTAKSITTLRELVTEFLENSEALADDDDDKNSLIIKEVIGIVRSTYMNDISLESVAKQVFLTPSYLSHRFKNETGTSFTKYLNQVRMEQAARLLKTTLIKTSMVSEMCGFTDTSYFCSVFKSYYGMTSAQYRNQFLRGK